MAHVPEDSTRVLAGLDPALLDAYLAGTCTPSERRTIDAWIKGGDGRRALLEGVQQGVERTFDYPEFRDAEGVRARVLARSGGFARIQLGVSSSTQPHRGAWRLFGRLDTGSARPRMRAVRARLGALTVLVVAVSIGALHSWRSGASADTTHTYATTHGQFAVITLRDGSRVTLAPRTTLVLGAGYGAHDRVMTLSGAAHFDVVSDQRCPLEIRTGAVTTRVLGTTFDIRRYPGERTGVVTVVSGKVATGVREGSMTLAAGMSGRFTDSAVIGAVANDSMMYTDWARGRLIFNNAPVPMVLATLRQWYGYEFLLADSALATRHVSAVFATGDSREMLSIVTHVLRVSVTRQDSLLILRPLPARGTRVDAPPRRTSFPMPTEVGR